MAVVERIPTARRSGDIRRLSSTGGRETTDRICDNHMIYNPPFYKKLFHFTRRMLAEYWLSMMPALQIGITGSQGKTNTTRVLSKLLSSVAPTIVTDVNLDTIYNVPITALKVRPSTKFAVFELGVDHPGEMDFHLQIVKPKIGVVTGISPVHTDKEHFGSIENLIKEKRKLIEALPEDGYAILNYDDENVRQMASRTKAKVLWYGTDPKHCEVWSDPKSVRLSLEGTSFTMFHDLQRDSSSEVNVDKKTTSEVEIRTKLIGKHHVYTILSSLLTCLTATKLADMNAPINQLIRALAAIEPLLGRMSVEKGPMSTIILNDALRANPTSTAVGLQTLSELEYKEGKKIAILAEMGELQHPEVEHKKIGQLLKTLNIDYVIGIGPMQRYVVEESQSKQAFFAKDVYEATETLKKFIKKGDLIYLKGSLYRHVERVLQILEGKKPPADLIIERSVV